MKANKSGTRVYHQLYVSIEAPAGVGKRELYEFVREMLTAAIADAEPSFPLLGAMKIDVVKSQP